MNREADGGTTPEERKSKHNTAAASDYLFTIYTKCSSVHCTAVTAVTLAGIEQGREHIFPGKEEKGGGGRCEKAERGGVCGVTLALFHQLSVK